VLVDVERAHRLWVDMGRSAALYAMRGFLAGFDIARARRDGAAVERWRDVVLAITSQTWEGDRTSRAAQTYVSLDLDTIRQRLNRAGMEDRTRVDVHERDLSLLVDFREPISFEMCKGILDIVIASGARPLEGQARRMLALISGDAAQATQAAEVFDSCQGLPYAARARAEAALMSGDTEAYASAVAVLERLGDEDQILRYAAWAG
jgi:hypothetical protein